MIISQFDFKLQWMHPILFGCERGITGRYNGNKTTCSFVCFFILNLSFAFAHQTKFVMRRKDTATGSYIKKKERKN